MASLVLTDLTGVMCTQNPSLLPEGCLSWKWDQLHWIKGVAAHHIQRGKNQKGAEWVLGVRKSTDIHHTQSPEIRVSRASAW